MIRRVSLRNFRGVERGEAELEAFTLLVGRNGSGKTTLLEALFLAPNPVREVPYSRRSGGRARAVEVVVEEHGWLGGMGPSSLLRDYVSEEASISCELDEGSATLRMRRVGRTVSFEVRASGRISERLKGTAESEEGWASLGSASAARSDGVGVKVSSTYGLGYMEESLLVSDGLLRRAWGFVRENWVEIVNRGLGIKAAEEASRILGEEYSDLTIEPLEGELCLLLLRRDGRRIRVGDAGAGARNLILVKVMVELARPAVLLWDDLETHMNPSSLARCLEWLQSLAEEGVQVVASTHSLEAVRMAYQVAGEETGFSVLVTELRNGVLLTKKLEKEDLESVSRAGLDVRLAGVLL